MKKYTMPKAEITALSKADIITASGDFSPSENELPMQPFGSISKNGFGEFLKITGYTPPVGANG